MPWRRKLSDAEFVSRIRQQTPTRRRAGGIALGVSLILCGCFLYFLQMLTTGEWRFEGEPAEQLAFQMGAMSGAVVVMALFGAIWWFVLGFDMYFRDRKDRLLLDYHRRLSELNQLP